MKKLLIFFLLLFANGGFSSEYVIKVPNNVYYKSIQISNTDTSEPTPETPVDPTPEDPEEPEPIINYSCLDVLNNGESTGDGLYSISINGNLTSVFCEMTSHGGGWMKVTLNELQNNSFNYNNIMTDSKQSLNQEQITRFKYLVNNRIDLYNFNILVPFLLPQEGRSSVIKDTYHDLPQTDITIPFKLSATFWTWDGDTDKGRLYSSVYEADNTTFRLVVDTGLQNFSHTWPRYSYYGTVLPNDSKIRLYGQCSRVQGTQCSAEIRDVLVEFNHDLPKIDSEFYIK